MPARRRPVTARALLALGVLLLPVLPARAAGVPGAVEAVPAPVLTLAECVSLALRQNPATAIAAEGLAAAREKIGEAKGGRYPTVRFSSGYTYTTPAGAAAPEDSFDNRFSIRQTVFDGGVTASLVAGAAAGASLQETEVRRTGLDVALGAEVAYYEVLRRREVIDVARGSEESAERHVDRARELHRAGLAPRSDVIKAEVEVSAARLELVKAENAWLLAKAELAAAIGLPRGTAFSVARPEEVPAPPPSLEEVLAGALARRPELAGVQARLAAADAALRLAESGRYPSVSLDASYGWFESDFLPHDRKWSVGLSIGIPLFEQATARSKVNQAAAGRAGLLAAETQARRAVELEVERAWIALKETEERRAVLAKALERAEEDQRVSEGRYQEGVGNILEVIDAGTALTGARVGVVVARYDSAQARARLERALGGKAEVTTR